MKSAFLVSFDTGAPVSVDDRLNLKEWLGRGVRFALDIDADVAVDHLDVNEPTVSALVDYQSGAA
jgi:hypothetical protein